ncbi:MAG: two-component system phosphate regulon sensor histidine kinase PhoR [Flavobacteriales bacterium]|jgi:two-component system phosphate regulon sensor histidine kinase PhoR
MLRKGLSSELRWLFAYILAIAFIGFSLGHLGLALIVALGSYLALILYRLNHLERWVFALRRGQSYEHSFNGVWAEIAEDIRLIHAKFEKDRVRLQAVVNRVQDVTSALNDGIILLDKRGNIDWWNHAARDILGFKDVDKGQMCTNILRDFGFKQYFESEEYEHPLDTDSSRYEEQFLQYQIHSFGHGERLIVVRDVTRVKKLEQMRRDFVANVSHELRTPLTVIRGYVETLIDAPGIAPMVKRPLEQMQTQGMRMTSLINDLLTLTKLETDDRSQSQGRVALKSLVESIFSDARAISSELHTYVCGISSDLHLQANEDELRSALSNLIMNALKYSPDGCKINVVCETLGDHLYVHVEDSGLGIDPKHIPRLTERFYRVDAGRSSSMGGTGLGLAIVKHILLRHDGYLNVRSQLGKGSVFTCCLPVSRIEIPSHEEHL